MCAHVILCVSVWFYLSVCVSVIRGPSLCPSAGQGSLWAWHWPTQEDAGCAGSLRPVPVSGLCTGHGPRVLWATGEEGQLGGGGARGGTRARFSPDLGLVLARSLATGNVHSLAY